MKKNISIKYIIISTLILFSCTDKETALDNINKGYKYYADSSFSPALNEFSLAIKKDNKIANAYYGKGLCEVRLHKNQDALISFQKALNNDSLNIPTLLERAKLKILLSDYLSGINDCKKASVIQANNPDVFIIQGGAYEKMDDFKNAILCYETAIQIDKDNGLIYYKLGVLKLSNREEACTLFSKAGELGCMEAYDMIKQHCNTIYKEHSSSTKESKLKKDNNVENKKDSVYDWNKKYVSQTYGYSIKIPETFTKSKGNRPHIDLKFVDDFGSSILVNVSPRQKDEYKITAHDFTIDMIEQALRQGTPNVVITHSEKLIVGREKAFLTESENAFPNSKSMECYLYHKDFAYVLTGTCEKDKFENYRQLFKSAITSLEL